jgi:hypothetical protein
MLQVEHIGHQDPCTMGGHPEQRPQLDRSELTHTRGAVATTGHGTLGPRQHRALHPVTVVHRRPRRDQGKLLRPDPRLPFTHVHQSIGQSDRGGKGLEHEFYYRQFLAAHSRARSNFRRNFN